MALTRSQIKTKINTLTRQKSNYENQKSGYNTSLTYANRLLSNLESSLKNLDSSEDYLKKYFTINNKTADNGKIETVRTKLSQITKKIKNTIIPEINNQIRKLDSNISSLTIDINRLKRQYETAEK